MYNLRKVTENDIRLLFDWANDLDTRMNAKNSDPIKWEDHVKWFEDRISSDSSFMYILEETNQDIGLVRFDKEKKDFIITYYIIKDYRGKGLGKIILEEGFKNLLKVVENPDLLAYVKKGNIASEKIFEKLNFTLNKEEIINNAEFKVFQKKMR